MEDRPVGRPRKYQNVEELEKLIDDYFKCCDQNHRPYTVTGLALWLDMTRQDLIRYEKDYGDEFSYTIKRAKARVEEFVECCLFKKGIAAGTIFNLKNNFGWEDKQAIEHTGDVNNPMQGLTSEELRAFIKQGGNGA